MTAIILVGMPGAGKSTLGVLLAKKTGRAFVDTDLLIQQEQGRLLQDIVDNDGYLVLREIEEGVLLGLTCENAVIATGGSAVYSNDAMEHLKTLGTVVYLQLTVEQLEARNLGLAERGLACPPGQTLKDIFHERCPLYERYADIFISLKGDPEESVVSLLQALNSKENS